MANERKSRRAEQELDQAERWIGEDPRDRRVGLWALGIALAFHAVILVARMPDWGSDPVRVEAPAETAMKVQFLEPPPPAPPKPPVPEPPKPDVKKIARPDDTPDEPEPVVEPEPQPAPEESPATSASPAPAQTGPIRVSAGQGPGLIKRVEPIYPPVARATRLQGQVVLDAVIRADGTVGDVTVIQSASPMFDQSAIHALKQWRFTPGDHDVIMSLNVYFKLDR
ncbi:MAG TPA: energy transducer TonB [Thermoanaerobaculia bacterium]|nr:energy transducer TonB [Thermoanaerobaculia bacterium]